MHTPLAPLSPPLPLHALVVQGLLLPALPRLSVVSERGLLLGVEGAGAVVFAAVADLCCPPLLIRIHTAVRTGLWLRWANREGIFRLRLYRRLFRSLHALVVQGLLLPALPRLSVVRERGLLVGGEGAEAVVLAAVVDLCCPVLPTCTHALTPQ
jgi:hypothetical protein